MLTIPREDNTGEPAPPTGYLLLPDPSAPTPAALTWKEKGKVQVILVSREVTVRNGWATDVSVYLSL